MTMTVRCLSYPEVSLFHVSNCLVLTGILHTGPRITAANASVVYVHMKWVKCTVKESGLRKQAGAWGIA